MTSTDTYQLKWHSHMSHLNGSVASLLRSERFTDVVLCTMDGSQIPAHKFILSSCSVYLCNLFEGQRSVTRMGGMLYVVLPSEISTKALKILVEYMYKGETTVSNEVLDTVLKAGEVLKIRGLWRQTDEAGGDTTAEKQQPAATTSLNKAPTPAAAKKADADVVQVQAKIAVKKDDKLLKTFGPLQPQGGTGRPMFIGPPKLVFIKTNEGGAQMALRPGAPKGQTILVAPAPQQETTTITIPSTPSPERESPMEISAPKSPRVLRRQTERKYGKRNRTEANNDEDKSKDGESTDESTKKSLKTNSESLTEVSVKEEPEWDASSIEEEERSIAEMFQAEMSVKAEPVDDVDIEEESLCGEDCQIVEEKDTLTLEDNNRHQDISENDGADDIGEYEDLATLTPLQTETKLKSPPKRRSHVELPIDSEEAFAALENRLEDPVFRKSLTEKFLRLCSRRGRGTWTYNANFLVDYMFSRSFMTLCSWTGATNKKDGTTRIRFKGFKKTVNLFFNVVSKLDKGFTVHTCEKFFMTVLKNSRQRVEAQGAKHQSNPRAVPLFLNSGDSDSISDDEENKETKEHAVGESTIDADNPASEAQTSFSLKQLPIDSVEALSALEQSLASPETQRKLRKGFSTLCCERGQGSGLRNAYQLVDLIFTRKLMTQCSWTGVTRVGLAKVKTPLRTFRRTILMFYEIVKNSDKLFTFRHCEMFLKTILKNAQTRNKASLTRRSMPRYRSKILADLPREVKSDEDRAGDPNEIDTMFSLFRFDPTNAASNSDVKHDQPLKTEIPGSFNRFPIDSAGAWKSLEEKLRDPLFKKVLRKKFIQLCSQQDARSGLGYAYILIDMMFTRQFLVTCSWNGGSRDGNAKTRAKSFTNTITLFAEVVWRLDKSFTYRDCVKFFCIILKNARTRAQSKGLKRSAPKRRAKLWKPEKLGRRYKTKPLADIDMDMSDDDDQVTEVVAGPSRADPTSLEHTLEVEFSQEILSQLIPDNSRWVHDYKATQIHEGLPIDTEESLVRFEQELTDPELRERLLGKFASVCSHKGPGTALHNAYVLVDYIFTRRFFTLVSWSGSTRGDTPKVCFKVYRNVIQFFSDLLLSLDETHTMEKCRLFFQRILRNASQRLLSKQLRRSTPKARRSRK